jgi:hypothetical protein
VAIARVAEQTCNDSSDMGSRLRACSCGELIVIRVYSLSGLTKEVPEEVAQEELLFGLCVALLTSWPGANKSIRGPYEDDSDLLSSIVDAPTKISSTSPLSPAGMSSRFQWSLAFNLDNPLPAAI